MSQPGQDERSAPETRDSSITSTVLPGSTPFPNFFLDVVMPLVSATVWKVFCFVWRKTVGWQKRQDHISLSQIGKGCGVSRDAAIKALGHDGPLVGLVRKAARNGLRGTIAYEPVLDYNETEVTGRLKRLVEKNDQSKKHDSTSRKNTTPLVGKSDTQKATIQNPSTQETNPSVSRKRKPQVSDVPGFNAFWEIYPKKEAKQSAIKAWRKLNPDAELQAAILRAVEDRKKTRDWLKENGQYVPQAVKWLNGRRWEDEIGPSSTITGGTNAGSRYAEVPIN